MHLTEKNDLFSLLTYTCWARDRNILALGGNTPALLAIMTFLGTHSQPMGLIDALFLKDFHAVIGSKCDQRVRVWSWQHIFCSGKDKGRSSCESRSVAWPNGQIPSCSQELFNIHSCKRDGAGGCLLVRSFSS